jgi:hypothetical protein
LVVQILTFAVAMLAAQAAGREGTVTGTLTLNGTSLSLTHVYASAEPGFFDKKAEDVHVLLSDVPLADDARADTFALIHLARDGKARIVEVVIDSSGTPIGGSIFAKDFDGMVSVTGMHKFTRERMERTEIAGRLGMDAPHTFMNVTFQYDARFSAPIPRPLTPQALAASLESPPARAATAYVSAVRRGELAGFLRTLSASLAGDYKGSDGASRLRDLSADMPADTRVTSVSPQTDGSVVVEVEGHRKADGMAIGYTLKLIQEDGAWKVGK